MPTQPGEAPLPRVVLARVFALRDHLYHQLWKPFYGDRTVAKDRFTAMVDIAREEIPKADPTAITSSIEHLVGTRIDEAGMRALAWRLAGNVDNLAGGIPARPWTLQRESEWVPIQFMRARPGVRGKFSKRGCLYDCLALAGSPAGMTMSLWWYQDQYVVAASELGFTPSWGARPFEHAAQLVGMRTFALVTPEDSKGKPGFRQIKTSSSMLKRNQEVMAVRTRKVPCPFGFLHPCHKCDVGYTGENACPAATHALPYVYKDCLACGEEERPHDPEEAAGVCVHCVNTARFKQED